MTNARREGVVKKRVRLLNLFPINNEIKQTKKRTREIRLFGATIGSEIVKHKKAKPIDETVDRLEVPQALTAAIVEHGGSEESMAYVGFKVLTESDIKNDQNRLYIPKTVALIEYLNEDEKAIIEQGSKVIKVNETFKLFESIKIGVLDNWGRYYNNIEFKNWKSVDQPIFKTEWNNIVKNNNLQKDDRVDIYAFRFADGKLGFALNIGR